MATSEIISTIAVILSFVGVLSSFVFSYKKADKEHPRPRNTARTDNISINTGRGGA